MLDSLMKDAIASSDAESYATSALRAAENGKLTLAHDRAQLAMYSRRAISAKIYNIVGAMHGLSET